ncbi:MAG: matrixin family metalloprotease [Myxococcota bacterium]
MRQVVLLLFLLSGYANGYAFLCNGVDAEGQSEQDTCGVCDDTTATKWRNSYLQYWVSTTELPASLNASSWISLVNSCFASWNTVSGVHLTTNYSSDVVSPRSFGDDSEHHDVFWVNNDDEWMEYVGAAPDGILGVTLPPYACQTSSAKFRVIQDADLILNGTPTAGFKWQPECSRLSNSCQSIRSTLTHELGHFLGLGHPCVDSSSAIMCATAAYLVQYPLFDDQQGIRALYADGSSGAYATRCSSNTDCSASLQCHTQNGSKYCSHACTEDADCDNHLMCTSGFCEFPAGSALGAADLHEECSESPCDQGLICVGVNVASEPAYYCFEDCSESSACSKDRDTCRTLKNSKEEAIASKACIQVATATDERCGVIDNVPVVCPTGYSCSAEKCQQSTTGESLAATGGSSGGSSSSCASAGPPGALGMLLVALGILVPRRRKKC